MTVETYRKKSVEIQAIQFTGGAENASEIIDWITSHGGTASWTQACEGLNAGDPSILDGQHGGYPASLEGITVSTLEGPMFGAIGWWFLRGVRGEFYPCKPDIFAETYDRVRQSQTARAAQFCAGDL